METRKLLTKQFIKKVLVKTVVFILIMVFISAISQAIAPVISNDIAMGQMENSDELYVMMELYNKMRPIVDLAYIVAIVWFVSIIVRDTNKFIKTIRSDNIKTH